jgi:hypothetical protein
MHGSITPTFICAAVVAWPQPPIKHKWIWKIFGWAFGVVEWDVGDVPHSHVHAGPFFLITTDLSAPAVATISGAIALIAIIGLAFISARVIRHRT